MPVQRRRINRRQSLPTISELHGAISSFPIPEIKGAPQGVAPFRVGSPELPSLIERDDPKTSRERRMGRRTKEEREARRKAKKEKRRAEKKRAKGEVEGVEDETSTTSKGITSDPISPPVSGDHSIRSPSRESPKLGAKSPIVSLDEAIKKRELMQARMDNSELPLAPISGDTEAGTGFADETSGSGTLVPSEMQQSEERVLPLEKVEGNRIATSRPETDEPTTSSSKIESPLSERQDINASTSPLPATVTSRTSVSLYYEQNDHKLQASCPKMAPIEPSEAVLAPEKSEFEEMKKQLVASEDGKKPPMPKIDNHEGPEDYRLPQISADSADNSRASLDIFEGMSPEEMEETVLELIQMSGDEDPETKAELEALLNELIPQINSQSSLNHLVQDDGSSRTETLGADEERLVAKDDTTADPMTIESVQKPSEPDEPLIFATKGPYARRGSFSGSVDELTVEISQSSSDNDSDDNPIRHLGVDENDANVYDSELVVDENDINVCDSEYSDTNPNMERNMRRISIRRASLAGPKPQLESISDGEDASVPGAATIAPHPSVDERGDRPMLARRESKSDLRKFRQGPQVLTTSAFGVVRLSDQHTLESSFIRDEEEVVADDDIFVHAVPVYDDHVPNNAAREDYPRYNTRSNEQERFSAHGSSEFVVEEQKENQRGWILVIVLILVPAVSIAIYFAVASAIIDPESAVQSPTQPIGDTKYDPPTPEECRIIENGGALDGEDELVRRHFDLLIDVELTDGFSLDGPDGLLPSLQERMDKYLVPHLAGCNDVPRDRMLRHGTRRQLANVRYVIANADAIVNLDKTRPCEVGTSTNCYAMRLSLHLKLKGEEKDFPITKVIHQSLDANNSLSRTVQLSAPFYEAIVRDIIPTDASTMTPTESPSSSPSIPHTESPSSSPTMPHTESPSSSPTIKAPTESPSREPTNI